MKERKEYTKEERKKLAEKMVGKNYSDPGPLWGFKTLSVNWEVFKNAGRDNEE